MKPELTELDRLWNEVLAARRVYHKAAREYAEASAAFSAEVERTTAAPPGGEVVCATT